MRSVTMMEKREVVEVENGGLPVAARPLRLSIGEWIWDSAHG
jgi:hypothetical protein